MKWGLGWTIQKPLYACILVTLFSSTRAASVMGFCPQSCNTCSVCEMLPTARIQFNYAWRLSLNLVSLPKVHHLVCQPGGSNLFSWKSELLWHHLVDCYPIFKVGHLWVFYMSFYEFSTLLQHLRIKDDDQGSKEIRFLLDGNKHTNPDISCCGGAWG